MAEEIKAVKKKSAPHNYVIGYFDKNTRLSSSAHSFDIQMRTVNKVTKVETWTAMYFYAWIGDAIRGYAKYAARRAGKEISVSKDLSALLDAVAKLETEVRETGKHVTEWWEKHQKDPVEKAIIDQSIEDPEESSDNEENDA